MSPRWPRSQTPMGQSVYRGARRLKRRPSNVENARSVIARRRQAGRLTGRGPEHLRSTTARNTGAVQEHFKSARRRRHTSTSSTRARDPTPEVAWPRSRPRAQATNQTGAVVFQPDDYHQLADPGTSTIEKGEVELSGTTDIDGRRTSHHRGEPARHRGLDELGFPTSTTIACTPNPVQFGNSVRIHCKVTGDLDTVPQGSRPPVTVSTTASIAFNVGKRFWRIRSPPRPTGRSRPPARGHRQLTRRWLRHDLDQRPFAPGPAPGIDTDLTDHVRRPTMSIQDQARGPTC